MRVTWATTRISPSAAPTRPAWRRNGAQLVITLVDFENDIVHIRNVSGGLLRLDPQEAEPLNGWRLEIEQSGTLEPLPNGFEIAAGADVRIHLDADGSNDAGNIYLDLAINARDLQWHMDASDHGGEIAVLSAPDEGEFYTNNPDVMEALSAGECARSPGPSISHRDEAVTAGIWSDGEDAFIADPTPDDGDDPSTGIIAVGDVTDPETGWEIVPADCID
jgi:hypothetical protein